MGGAPFLLYEAVDRSAARRPDGVIFRCDEQALTYADFAARSNRLAHMLRAQGVRRGDRVGIYLHKSMESGIALYGIMKAGAAYVPLDPGLPVSRLAFVLRDCGIRHVISERRRLPALAEAAAEPGVTLDCVVGPAGSPDRPTPWRSVSWADVAALDGASPPDNRGLIDDDLAYVMYTSGSTGTPKGLIHTHRSGLSYARMAARVYDVGPDDVLSNHSPLHFDMSTFDFFSGPLRGATTVIIPEPYMKLPASLSELMEEERITIWYSVTTALVELLLRGALDRRDLSALRWVNFGGEVFPPKHLRALMALLPHARFSNVYGPAEVNQCTFFHVPPLPNEFGETPVPIGRPWALADGLVVGPDDRPVAPGEPGELLIASPTRMQGYWNRPDLTEQGFFRQQPFPGSPYEKIYYRTGDLVQDPGDGELRFLGRKDRQVKIRGFRVELDEIETALAAHPAVAEAAVYTLSGDDGEQQLEAAVILRAGASAGPDDLLAHLARHLPSYAVPATLLLRDAFPRTGSGKLNRRALQALSLEERGIKEPN